MTFIARVCICISVIALTACDRQPAIDVGAERQGLLAVDRAWSGIGVEELGYTFGTNAISVEDSTGASTTTNGKYVTIWRKQTDGSWKVVVDITNSDSLPITDPQRDQ
jgi:hypothetical protein